jgi:hypothetical protein
LRVAFKAFTGSIPLMSCIAGRLEQCLCCIVFAIACPATLHTTLQLSGGQCLHMYAAAGQRLQELVISVCLNSHHALFVLSGAAQSAPQAAALFEQTEGCHAAASLFLRTQPHTQTF